MLEVAVLYGCDLSQVFTPIILRLYQPHSLREKGATRAATKAALYVFLLPPLRGGRLIPEATMKRAAKLFLLAPLREGRRTQGVGQAPRRPHFYSRPYARGDTGNVDHAAAESTISTHAPTRGATQHPGRHGCAHRDFYSRPYARGDLGSDRRHLRHRSDFYSRPYTRGDPISKSATPATITFLLAPLHEGRHFVEPAYLTERISTPAPT